jgi:hypothetical protein
MDGSVELSFMVVAAGSKAMLTPECVELIRKNNKVSYPFLENPDEREQLMYICLVQCKPFVTERGKGVIEALAAGSMTSIHKQTRRWISLSLSH